MVDTSDSFRVIRWYDPELEEHCELADVIEYRQELDPDVLKLPPEAKPVIFTCRLLRREQRRHLYSLAGKELQWEGAFQYGVTSIENVPRDGRMETLTPDRRGSKSAPMSDAELDRLGFGDDDLHEVGRVILEKSRLGKGVPLRLEPLPSSQRAWLSVATAAASRRAEREPDSTTTEESPST